MIALIEPLLLAIGKIDLATGFLINIVLPPPLQRERKLVFFLRSGHIERKSLEVSSKRDSNRCFHLRSGVG